MEFGPRCLSAGFRCCYFRHFFPYRMEDTCSTPAIKILWSSISLGDPRCQHITIFDHDGLHLFPATLFSAWIRSVITDFWHILPTDDIDPCCIFSLRRPHCEEDWRVSDADQVRHLCLNIGYWTLDRLTALCQLAPNYHFADNCRNRIGAHLSSSSDSISRTYRRSRRRNRDLNFPIRQNIQSDCERDPWPSHLPKSSSRPSRRSARVRPSFGIDSYPKRWQCNILCPST